MANAGIHYAQSNSGKSAASRKITGLSPKYGDDDTSRWAPVIYLNWRIEMPRNIYVVLFVLIMIAVIVSVDLLFFRNQFWERLIANIGIVLVFVAFYLRFLKNP
jgi:hypothetical protein